jgi:hypothetical protein
MMDGKLMQAGDQRCGPERSDIVARDKSLAEIERGFKVLESEIAIAPVFHCFANVATAMPLDREGRLRGLAASSLQRTPIAPEVPTSDLDCVARAAALRLRGGNVDLVVPVQRGAQGVPQIVRVQPEPARTAE